MFILVHVEFSPRSERAQHVALAPQSVDHEHLAMGAVSKLSRLPGMGRAPWICTITSAYDGMVVGLGTLYCAGKSSSLAEPCVQGQRGQTLPHLVIPCHTLSYLVSCLIFSLLAARQLPRQPL
jgi:hypothetical protein